MKKLSFITRTSLLLAFFFGLDKLMAFGKSILYNRIVGLDGMGIFTAANGIPDYLSALLSGGALGIAFIPVLRQMLDHEGQDEAWDLFSRILNLAFLVTGLFFGCHYLTGWTLGPLYYRPRFYTRQTGIDRLVNAPGSGCHPDLLH